jgi:hypothetical protein
LQVSDNDVKGASLLRGLSVAYTHLFPFGIFAAIANGSAHDLASH